MAAHVKKEIKEEILKRIKNGEKATEVADHYGVHQKTVYGWLGWQAKSSVSVIEYHKLKRERDTLLQLVGELMLKQKSTRGKNSAGA
jgi:DNA invertase Pin-like site-specific DNA recombinase